MITLLKYIGKVLASVTLIFGVTFPICSFGMAHGLEQLIDSMEKRYAVPTGLLAAIAKVESNGKPYAIGISGKTIYAKTKEEAAGIVQQHLKKGLTNIDLGIMQINFYWHGKYFTSVEEMLTPGKNIEYAAKFLSDLYNRHGSWNKAVRHYHCTDPAKHHKYSGKVFLVWVGN